MTQTEGSAAPFLGKPRCDLQTIFEGQRFPNVVVSMRGTVLATWGSQSYWVRRSLDGGATWEPAIEVARPGFHGGGTLVDERHDTILVFNEGEHPPKTPQKTMGRLEVYRSRDDGRRWERIEVTIQPDPNGYIPARHMCEHGITLRHSLHSGRLLRPARVYDKLGDKPRGYSCAIYSDDGGRNWKSSRPFPESGTGESGVVELANGDIYHNSRKHYFDAAASDFHSRRHATWSYNGGESWQDVVTVNELPDGPRYRGEERRGSNYNGHFGMLAGLVRLPVEGRDILLYSNADTPCHNRIRGTVWISFDGGKSWPMKRLVYEGPFAYSSLTAGWPGTPSEGWIYLQFEGGVENCYDGGWIARFNLNWLLGGQATGDGEVPVWITAEEL